jgi:hypothetical protein
MSIVYLQIAIVQNLKIVLDKSENENMKFNEILNI